MVWFKMAAYAALVSLMNILEDIQIHPHLSTSFDNKQLESLGEKLDFLLNFVESHNCHGGNKEAEDLESQIVSAAHAAEDVIEPHIVDQILAGSTADGETSSRLLPLQIATEAMDSIKKSIMEIESKGELRDNLPEYSSSSRSLTSSNTRTVGFDEESIQLIERLIRPEPDWQIIPIVGMGGTGKTTLVRFIYEHSLCAHHFDIRLWATISQEYSVENILSELLFGEKNSTGTSVNELGEQLHKKLWGRRYLIILDDMWTLETWNEIQLFLPHNGDGDRIVITTRLSNMAQDLSSFPFEMKFLDEEKSWRLFCAKAFGEEDCPPEIEEIGKNIVRKCKGLALSIVVMGGHLGKSSRMKGYWESVENDINSVLDSGEDQCLSILWLSYNHLPAHLKPCFLYMGVFEEDTQILASRLIGLLVSEGLVKPNEGKTKEEIAKDYLEDLADRNLILAGTRDYLGKYEFFKIHDLLRELSIKVARKEKFFCVVDSTTQTIDREQHRVIIPAKIILAHRLNREIFGSLRLPPLLRSVKCERGDLSSYFRLLRVPIDKVEIRLEGPSAPDFQQVNLRYLDCCLFKSRNASESNQQNVLYLPPSISLLWNLQTLKIWRPHDKIVAPSEIWKMPQLRHLDVRRFCLPDPPHSNGSELTFQNLHTLQQVKNLCLSEDVCRRIPNIRELWLEYDEASSSYCPHNLVLFHKLQSLSCFFSRKPSLYHFECSLVFPRSLESLVLVNSQLCWDNLAVIGSLPHLVELRLIGSDYGQEWNPIELGFPCLKFLMISGCYNFISWNADSSHFPVLEYLYLLDACKLDEIPSGIGEIPTLQCISLGNCSESATISAARILVEQEELGNDGLWVKVRFYFKKDLGRFREILQEEGLTCKNLHLVVS